MSNSNLKGSFMKIVFSDKKTGRTAQAELSQDIAATLYGKKVGDTLEGEVIGLSGYRLQITGGSDNSGFPMYKYVQGYVKTGVLGESKKKGSKTIRRKTVVGGMIGVTTAQVNTAVVEYGSKPAEEVFPIKEKKKSEESK